MHCNSGIMTVTKISDLKRYRTIWFYLDGIAHIKLVLNVKNKYHRTDESAANDSFEVHRSDHTKHMANTK